MGNVRFGEGRCKQVRKDTKELQQLRLKIATGNEALTDKRGGGSGVGWRHNTGTPGLAVRVFPMWRCPVHEWL